MRSRPMRWKRPRYSRGRPPTGSRPQTSERGIRRTLARAARPQKTFTGCSGSRDRHSCNGHRAYGAGCARASLDHHPSPRRRLGGAAWRVARRSWRSGGNATNRLVAGRPRSSCTTTRTGPCRLSLLVDKQQRGDRTHRLDRHAYAPPSPCRHPGSAAGTGRESVERTS